MAKGNLAKADVINKIIAAMGDNYVGTADNKYYFWGNDGGERVQIAVSMTCPKVPLDVGSTDADDDFFTPVPHSAPTTEFTQEERKNIQDLLNMF